jgi:hypothetical protein
MPTIDIKTFEDVFKDYISFLGGVNNAADEYVKRNQSVVSSNADRTPLQLRIISDTEGQARRVEECIGRLITSHKVWVDPNGTISSAAREMEQIRGGALGRHNKLYVIMIDSGDIPNLAEKMKDASGYHEAMCFVRVDESIVQGGGWRIPKEWLGAFMRMKVTFQYGIYFVMDKLCFQSEYENSVAAALVTLSQMFDKSRSMIPVNPVQLTDQRDKVNSFALVSVSGVNVCRIGVLLTCAVKLMKKLDSSEKDERGAKIERSFEDVCRLADFHATIGKVQESIAAAVNVKDILSQMASLPLDGGCEQRLLELQPEKSGCVYWSIIWKFICKLFGWQAEKKTPPLRWLLGLNDVDTRHDDYFNEYVTKVWDEAMERWLTKEENLYQLFFELINCFADFKSARSEWNQALTRLYNEMKKQLAEFPEKGDTQIIYNGEADIRMAAERYVNTVYGKAVERGQMEIYLKIVEKLLTHDVTEKFYSVIDELFNRSLNVSNTIWDEYHNEIIGFRNGVHYNDDGLSRDGDYYFDGMTEGKPAIAPETSLEALPENRLKSMPKPLDVPDVARFVPNREKIARMRDALSQGLDDVPCTVTTDCDIPADYGEWSIVDDNGNTVEKYTNGKICFVMRQTSKHSFYTGFDSQRVVRVKINVYSLDNRNIDQYLREEK